LTDGYGNGGKGLTAEDCMDVCAAERACVGVQYSYHEDRCLLRVAEHLEISEDEYEAEWSEGVSYHPVDHAVEMGDWVCYANPNYDEEAVMSEIETAMYACSCRTDSGMEPWGVFCD